MADLSFIYDPEKGHSDMQIVDGDFLIADDLQTAVEISLFSDRRARDSEVDTIQAGRKQRVSRKGYWANSFKENIQGSALWILYRGKRSQETLELGEKTATESLQHLVTNGVASKAAVECSFDGENLVVVAIITKPDGQEKFNYSFAWDELEGL